MYVLKSSAVCGLKEKKNTFLNKIVTIAHWLQIFP